MTTIDPYTIRHLDTWLDAQVCGDARREATRSAILAFIADDPEYWSGQAWWNVYDHAKCDRFLNQEG